MVKQLVLASQSTQAQNLTAVSWVILDIESKIYYFQSR